MPEESSSPEPQDEAPRKKSPAKSVKSAKKKAAEKAAPTEKSKRTPRAEKSEQPAKPEKRADAPKSEKAATPDGADRSEKAEVTNRDSDSNESRPDIKRGVRGAKKTASKKSAGKKSTESPDQQEGQPATSNNKDAGDRNHDDAQRKQARRGRNRNRNQNRQDQPQQEEPKVKLDAKKVAKRAWKIFLGEVTEEGLALVADKEARELARRSLRVAEIYSHEEAVFVQKGKKKKAGKKGSPQSESKPSKRPEQSEDK
jgi:hypothetical protein